MWFWILEQRYGPISQGHFYCHVDDDTVVKRISQGRPNHDVATKALVTDYDLWVETTKVLANIKCKHQFVHVKGHQDDFIAHGNQQGPLPRHAFWNVQMDKLAARTRQSNAAPPLTPFIPSSKIALMIDGSAVTTSTSRVIRDILVANPMEEYIRERENWTKQVFHSVDWKAMDRAMGALSIHKRVNAAKYMFDWQNTGEQKQRFEDSAAQTEDRKSSQVNLCPLKCGCTETAQHFLKCQVIQNAKIMDQCLTSLHRWFSKHRTHPVI